MKMDGIRNVQNTVNAVEKVPAQIRVSNSSEIKATNGVVTNDSGHKEVITDEMLEKAIKAANKTLVKHNNFIERSVHDVTKTVMYVMKDTLTDEVIREFPPKKIQDMIAKMWEMAGLFVDEKA